MRMGDLSAIKSLNCDFAVVRCVKGGAGFAYGRGYAAVGNNNAVQVCRRDQAGDTKVVVFHNYAVHDPKEGELRLPGDPENGPRMMFVNNLYAEVVHCAECVHCQRFNDRGDFYCEVTDTDFYYPHYDAATYYCADGTRRSDDGRAGD